MEDNDRVDLTDEQMEDLIKAHENIFELKDKLASVLDGHPSNDCFFALRMMLVQFLCDTCVSKDSAMDMIGAMTGSSIMILNNMDEMGACAWNYPDQTLQ